MRVARRDVSIDDEKRSYSAVFLLAVGLLLVGAIWSVWDDNIARRPWKYHQAEFSAIEQQQVRDDIKAEEDRLATDPVYQQVNADLAAAGERLHTGATAKRIADLEARQKRVKVQHGDIDLKLRIIKSRLEEAWYDYDTAVLEKKPTDAARARIDVLDKEKAGIQKGFDDTKAQLEQIDKEMNEVGY